jgi:hypothetical protein
MPAEMSELDRGLAALLGGAEKLDNIPAAATTPPAPAEMPDPGATPDPESGDAEAPAPEETPPPQSLKDLAAKAGLDVKQLYAMELPGLEGMTLGDVKDRAKELREVDATRATVETERTGVRQERLRWMRELAAAKAAGLHEFSEQEQAQIGQLLQRHAETEAETIMAAIPDWANSATLKADFEGIAAELKPWGFTPQDVALYLEGDARWALFMHDQLARSRRLKAAEAKVKAPPKKLQAPAGNGIPKRDQLQKMYGDSRLSAVDRGLAALLQGAQK